MAQSALKAAKLSRKLSVRREPAQHPSLGANYLGNGHCSFCVWAPYAKKVTLCLVSPQEREAPLAPAADGYHLSIIKGVFPGARYFLRIAEDKLRPDPASRYQPETVHGPSEVVHSEFDWEDQQWTGLPLRNYILYELHVGTATKDGTFEALIPHLPELKSLGITALELMPVAQFSGTRNWGYNGVFPFAVQNSYGGPRGLKRLVNACHKQGLAVVLDVVYNHFGPEGNYFRDFGPYLNGFYKTPWGEAINFDGKYSDHVRHFFLENALCWQTEFHLDALRLDAIHTIRDFSALPFLLELARATQRRGAELGRPFHLIAESDLNDARIIRPETAGGLGLDAQWNDDFHHALHVLLTGESNGYYEDFCGVSQLAKIFREGYAFTGQYSPHRKRRHGNSPAGTSARQFVVYSQNHDQIGNRPLGERLNNLVNFERLKLAAGTVLLSPFLPLLFMGEEYGEPAPFRYIISHSDPSLAEAVREGRRQEFPALARDNEMPDPGAQSTFDQCVLNRELSQSEKPHSLLHGFYRELIRLRKDLPALTHADKDTLTATPHDPDQVLSLLYRHPDQELCVVFNFEERSVVVPVQLTPGSWSRLLDSARSRWAGPGSSTPDKLLSAGYTGISVSPLSVAMFQFIPAGAPLQNEPFSISA